MTPARWRLAGWLAALPVLAAPVGDPDLWWHLSAFDWMAAHGAWPRADWLSFTRAGAPWHDFEWLAQVCFGGAAALGGMAGLWLLKGVLLAGVLAAVFKRCARAEAPAAAAAAAACACALVPRADIRTDLFSLAAFAWLAYFIDRVRAGKRPPQAGPAALYGGAFFAVWANLHAGFFYGLALLALHAAAAWRERAAARRALSTAAVGGALGALCNPYGWRVYEVLWSHAADTAALARTIVEWAPLSPTSPAHWPSWLLLAGAAWSVYRRGRKGFGAEAAALLIFAVAGLRHARLAAYFAVLAVPVLAAAGTAAERRRWAPAVLWAATLFSAASFWNVGLGRAVHHLEYTPLKAAAFLERALPAEGLRLYHSWGWGGYLGRTRKVFQDGRYIFHDLLAQAAAASAAPESWQTFLDAHGVEAALMLRTGATAPMTRRYPDGGERVFRRPYFVRFMPREKWALIYFDDKALLFARRGGRLDAVIAEHAYRYLRPGDRAALRDAVARGEIDLRRLEAERARHAAVIDELPRQLNPF